MPRLGSLADVVGLIAAAPAGARIQVPSGLAQSAALIGALQADPQAAADKVFTGLFIPGVDNFDYSSLHPTARMETPLMAAHLRDGFKAGRVAPLPFSYYKVYERLITEGAEIGIAVVTPTEGNYFSFGMAADAGPAVTQSARLKVALVNEAAPRVGANRTIIAHREAFDWVVSLDEPLNWVKPEAPALGVMARVANGVAGLIEDLDVLQFGIGKLPGAILSRLTDRRLLGVHSGLYAEGLTDLLDAEAIDCRFSRLAAGVALGSKRLAERLIHCNCAVFEPVDFTHSPLFIGTKPRFTAINGALQVDLFGQVNSEFVGSQLVSGPGGLPDFVAGANRTERGRAIIALPSLAGSESRIVPRLETPWATLPRGLISHVVTEHGVAELRGKTLDQVARALIAIADPSAQDALSAAWAEIRSTL